MHYESFLHLVPAAERDSLSDGTLKLWHRIFFFVLTRGEADIADNDEFLAYCREETTVSEKTIGRHLSRMASSGLLSAHPMRRKANAATLILHRMMYFSAPTLPASFVRYTLVGKEPSLRLRRGEKLWKELRTTMRTKEARARFKDLGLVNPFGIERSVGVAR